MRLADTKKDFMKILSWNRKFLNILLLWLVFEIQKNYLKMEYFYEYKEFGH